MRKGCIWDTTDPPASSPRGDPRASTRSPSNSTTRSRRSPRLCAAAPDRSRSATTNRHSRAEPNRRPGCSIGATGRPGRDDEVHTSGERFMDTPLYVTASVLVAALFAVVALSLVINRSAPGLTGPFAGLVLAVWLVTTALLASNGAYQQASYGAVPPLGIALVLALAGIALAVGAVPQLRAILSDPAAQPGLLGLQVWRIVGLAFLVLLELRQLPGILAIPAGIGDSAIGVTAPFVARNLHRRNLAMAWNLFGVADLVLARS